LFSKQKYAFFATTSLVHGYISRLTLVKITHWNIQTFISVFPIVGEYMHLFPNRATNRSDQCAPRLDMMLTLIGPFEQPTVQIKLSELKFVQETFEQPHLLITYSAQCCFDLVPCCKLKTTTEWLRTSRASFNSSGKSTFWCSLLAPCTVVSHLMITHTFWLILALQSVCIRLQDIFVSPPNPTNYYYNATHGIVLSS
jgi:hypothetical protein